MSVLQGTAAIYGKGVIKLQTRLYQETLGLSLHLLTRSSPNVAAEKSLLILIAVSFLLARKITV